MKNKHDLNDDNYNFTLDTGKQQDVHVNVDSSKQYTIRMPTPRPGSKVIVQMNPPSACGGVGCGGAAGSMSGPGDMIVGAGGSGGSAGNGGIGVVTMHFKKSKWEVRSTNALEPMELEDFCAIAARKVESRKLYTLMLGCIAGGTLCGYIICQMLQWVR